MVETDRLVLRRWRPEDAAPLAALNADPEVMRHIGGGAPLTRAESDGLLHRFEHEWDDLGFSLWAVEDDDGFAGLCGLTVPTFLPAVLPAVEVGWRLRQEVWGRGYATESARAALDWGFATHGFAEIIAIVAPDNARSLGVCAKLGMEPRRDRVHPTTGGRVKVLAARLRGDTPAGDDRLRRGRP